MLLFRPYRQTFRHMPVSFELFGRAAAETIRLRIIVLCAKRTRAPERPESCTMIPGRMHMTLAIDQREREGILIMALAGRLTLGYEHLAFRTKMENCIDVGNIRIVLDCRQLATIDSAGLDAMVFFHANLVRVVCRATRVQAHRACDTAAVMPLNRANLRKNQISV